MGPGHGLLGALLPQLFLAQTGHAKGQAMGRQPVGVVQDRGHRQVLAAHGAVDDHLEAVDGAEGETAPQ